MLNIVMSGTKFSVTEANTVQNLFLNGLQIFHIRKPSLSKKQLRKYLELISSEYHSRIVIHSHHSLALEFDIKGIHINRSLKKSSWYNQITLRYLLWRKPHLILTSSMHHLSDLRIFEKPYDYVFLSPVFDSVSKKGYMASFTDLQIKTGLVGSKYKVIALGGVTSEKIKDVKELGFFGYATLGYIWESEDPLNQFLSLQNPEDAPSTQNSFGIVKPIKVSFSRRP